MEFKEYVFRSEMIENERAETEKNQMIAAAFTAWQLGAGSGKEFSAYLKSMGLSDKEPEMTKEEFRYVAKRAIEKAELLKRRSFTKKVIQ